MGAKSAKELRVYQQAYALAMEIFDLSKAWPKEETYSLTDQVHQSSQSVCANLKEAWAKRRYEAHFISTLTDADAENSETETWLDCALDCQYLPKEQHERPSQRCQEIGGMIGTMLKLAPSFVSSSDY